MPGPAESGPFVSRNDVEGAPIALYDGRGVREIASGSWNGIRVLHARAERFEVREAILPNHVVGLQLSGSTTWHVNLAEAGWRAFRSPVHGVTVIPAGVTFAAYAEDAREFVELEVAPEVASKVLDHGGPCAELCAAFGVRDPFAKYVMLALAEEARDAREAGALRVESLVRALVSHLAAKETRPRTPLAAGLSSPKLRRVLDYVAAHIEQPLTLRSLADLAEVEQFRFIRAFKLSTGLSPHRYVLEARIHRAKQLLEAKDLSITEIALATGFATPSHFSVTFRRIAGVTPRDYRDARS